MKLRLPHKLQAALIAVITTVGFTLTQAQADTDVAKHDIEFKAAPEELGAMQNISPKTDNWSIDSSRYGRGGDILVTWGGLALLEGSGLKANGAGHYTVTYLYIDPSLQFKASTNNVEGEINWSSTSSANDYFLISSTEGSWVDVNAAYGANTVVTSQMSGGTVYLNDKGSLVSTLADTNKVEAELLTSDYQGVTGYSFDESTGVLTRTLMTGNFSSWATPGDNITLTNKDSLDSTKLKYVANSNGLYVTYQLAAPTVQSFAWVGAAGGSDWSDPVWMNGEQASQNFIPGSNATFGAGAVATGVSITTEITAKNVTVGEQEYTFTVSTGGSLAADSLTVASNSLEIALDGGSVTPGNIEIASGAKLTISGTDGTLAIGNVTGAGTLAKNDSSTITLNQALSGFSGTFEVNAGTLEAAVNNSLGTGGVKVGAEGTLVLKTYTGVPNITGNGTVQIAYANGQSYEIHDKNFLEQFTGTVELVSGYLQIGKQGNKFANATLKLSGGEIRGWQGNFQHSILLNGGTIADANDNQQYSGAINVTAASTVSASKNHTVTLSGALSGSGAITKTGEGTVDITNISGYTGAFTVNQGSLLITTNNMPETLTVTGAGELHMRTNQNGLDSNLKAISAANLHLDRDNSHNSRFVYNGSTDLTRVNHLYFDGAQVWLNGAAMEFAGAVTFNATTYAESGQADLAGAAMRLNNNATFSGAVEVAQNTKLAFAENGTVVTFGGAVTGSGQLNLKSWNGNKTGTFKVSGNASTYTGAITTDSNITLAVEQNGQLALGDGSTLNGAVTLAGALTVNGSATVNGTLTQTGGSITVNEGKSLTLGNASLTSAISSTGTVVFTQNITAGGLQKVGEDDTYAVGADGARATDENYFYGTRTESTIRVVTGGTVTTGDHTVTQDDVAYALKTDGTATGVTADEVNYSAFYQGQAGTTVSVSQLAATAEAHDSELSAVYSIGLYDAPTVLNVDRNLATAQVAFSTINIANGVEYTGDLLIYGGMNTVGGRIGTDQLGFFGGNASVTTFTDAPVVDSGVRFWSDAGVGGVQVQANQRSGEARNYYYEYFIGDASYSVVASELSKEGEGAATVANSLMVQRIHNSEASSTDKLTLSAGAFNMSLQEVVATSGDIEFLNMAAANGTQVGKQTSVSLNNLEIGAEMTVSFYEAAAPSYEGEVVDETAVTVTGTLTACLDATLNADLVLGKKTPEGAVAVLDVSAMEGIGGLNMGSTVTLKPGELSLSDADMATVLAMDPNGMYDLFNGVDRFFVGTNVYSQIGISDTWVNAKEVFTNDFGEKDYYLFYSGETTTGGNGNNVGTIYIMQMPEPTTGTLSLLALAALAARRRKH